MTSDPSRSKRRDTLQTRKKLIEAAERLFAERGIDGVSLADINQHAEQKNRNAVHYHFGDKEALIHAVLDKHSALIEARRRQLLDTIGKGPALKPLVEALVLPVAEQLDNPDGGDAYLKINSQLMANAAYNGLRLERMESPEQARRMGRLFREVAADLSPQERSARMLLVDCMLFQGLAYYSTRQPRVARRDFVATLIDSIQRVMTAPPASGRRSRTTP
jgi:AcrR family transcriptional regulator